MVPRHNPVAAIKPVKKAVGIMVSQGCSGITVFRNWQIPKKITHGFPRTGSGLNSAFPGSVVTGILAGNTGPDMYSENVIKSHNNVKNTILLRLIDPSEL